MSDKLYLRVVEARGLPRADLKGKIRGGSSDPYCEIKVKGMRTKMKTQVILNTENPRWNEDFMFSLKNPNMDIIRIRVWDRDVLTPDDFLGEVEFRVAEFATSPGTHDVWRDLYKKNLFGLLGHSSRGQIHLLVSYGQPISQVGAPQYYPTGYATKPPRQPHLHPHHQQPSYPPPQSYGQPQYSQYQPPYQAPPQQPYYEQPPGGYGYGQPPQQPPYQPPYQAPPPQPYYGQQYHSPAPQQGYNRRY